MTTAASLLRAVCGHDSFSVLDCEHCTAADNVEAMARAALPRAEHEVELLRLRDYHARFIFQGGSVYALKLAGWIEAGVTPAAQPEGIDKLIGVPVAWMGDGTFISDAVKRTSTPVFAARYPTPLYAAPAAAQPEGIDKLIDVLERADRKGYLPDAIADAWHEFARGL